MTTYAQLQAKGLTFLKAQVGKGFLMGATGPNEYDCRGLTWATYEECGVNIGLNGSSGQFDDSTVKCTVNEPWLVLDQAFFWGSDPPRPGHTGVFVGIVNGQYTMIDAYDTAQGVRYNTFDPTVGGEQGLGFTGRTRPLLLAPNLTPPGGGDMTLVFAQGGAIGGIGANSYWLYSVAEDIGPYLWHLTDMDAVKINKVILPFKTITTSQATKLGAKLLNI
jgi:hypothetical protein